MVVGGAVVVVDVEVAVVVVLVVDAESQLDKDVLIVCKHTFTWLQFSN